MAPRVVRDQASATLALFARLLRSTVWTLGHTGGGEQPRHRAQPDSGGASGGVVDDVALLVLLRWQPRGRGVWVGGGGGGGWVVGGGNPRRVAGVQKLLDDGLIAP